MGGVTALAASEHRRFVAFVATATATRLGRPTLAKATKRVATATAAVSQPAGLNEQRHALDVALAIAVLMRVSPRLQLMVVRVPAGLEALSTHLREALTAAGFDLLGVFGAPPVAASMS